MTKQFEQPDTTSADPFDEIAWGPESERFDIPPAIVLDDDAWSDDAAVIAAWRARAPRRIFVKLVGWALLAAAGFGALQVAEEPKALGAIAAWATMGQVDVSPHAADVSAWIGGAVSR